MQPDIRTVSVIECPRNESTCTLDAGRWFPWSRDGLQRGDGGQECECVLWEFVLWIWIWWGDGGGASQREKKACGMK